MCTRLLLAFRRLYHGRENEAGKRLETPPADGRPEQPPYSKAIRVKRQKMKALGAARYQ